MSKTTLPQQSYELRDYQQELIQKILTQWSAGQRRVLAQLPTGGGKTVVVAAIAQQFTQRGGGILFLAHREELLLQAKQKLEAVTGCDTGLIKAGYPMQPERTIQIASVQSLVRRQNWPDAGLVVIDEAHHTPAATYARILASYPGAYQLGVTATPARSDGQGFRSHYDALVLGRSVRELIEADYLSPFKLFAAKKRVKAAGIKITAGDYNQRELAELVNTTLTLGDVIGTWEKHALNRKTVVFCVDVAYSRTIAEAYSQAGYAAEHLDGETPAHERRAILERFRSGETQILTNCSLFTEGVDVPDIEVVQCLRPTRSLTLHLQMLGRGLRPSAGKEHLIVLDHTENWVFHGLADEPHEWSLDPLPLGENAKWAIECPDCQHVFRPLHHEQKIRLATCPNCGSEIELEPSGEGQAVERSLTNDPSYALEKVDLEVNPLIMMQLAQLQATQQKLGYRPIWIYHRLIDRFPNVGLSELRECAKLLGYKPGWAWYKWQELQQKQAS